MFERFSVPKFSSLYVHFITEVSNLYRVNSFLLPFCKKERKPRRDTFSFVGKSTVPKSFPLRSHSVVKITENSMIQLGNSISSQQVLSLSLSSLSLVLSMIHAARREDAQATSTLKQQREKEKLLQTIISLSIVDD